MGLNPLNSLAAPSVILHALMGINSYLPCKNHGTWALPNWCILASIKVNLTDNWLCGTSGIRYVIISHSCLWPQFCFMVSVMAGLLGGVFHTLADLGRCLGHVVIGYFIVYVEMSIVSDARRLLR